MRLVLLTGAVDFFQLVFQVLLALMPIYVLSHDISLHQTTNTTDKANTSTEGSSGMFKRPLKILRRTDANQGPPVFLTAEPTNTKQVILFCRVGLFLQVDHNGTISSSLNQNSETGKYVCNIPV